MPLLWPTKFAEFFAESFYKYSYICHNGDLWLSNNPDYARTFAEWIDAKKSNARTSPVTGEVFLVGIPNNANILDTDASTDGIADNWMDMPFYVNKNGTITRLQKDSIRVRRRPFPSEGGLRRTLDYLSTGESMRRNGTTRSADKKLVTDDIVEAGRKSGAEGIYLHNVDDGPMLREGSTYDPNTGVLRGGAMYFSPIEELITYPSLTPRLKFIRGNNGDFNPYKEDKYSDISSMRLMSELG